MLHSFYWFLISIRYFRNWCRLYADKLMRKNSTILELRNGIVLSVAHRDMVIPIVDEIYHEKVYGNLRGLGSRPTIIDVGAHVGIFTTLAATMYPGGRVYSFEPSPTYGLLEENVRRNKLRNCILIKKGIAGASGMRTLYVQEQNTGTNSLVDHKGAPYQIETTTLPAFFSGFQTIDYLKVDIEGAEIEALDVLSTDDWRKIRRLAVECSENYRRILLERLIPLGFSEVSYIHKSLVLDRTQR
jgi:FkbM family methyltransferase